MVKIKKQLTTTNNKYGMNNGKKFITIHETGNTSKGANAQSHANLLSEGYSETWHWTVDDVQAIQSFTHNYQLYHAGDGRGNGNLNSIGIEICVNSDGNYSKAIQNTIELVQKIMKEETISTDRVVQHNHWSGKNCPSGLRSGRSMSWNTFKTNLGRTQTISKPITNNGNHIHSIALDVVKGLYGNGTQRKDNIYNTVQKVVNDITYNRTINVGNKNKHALMELAKEVIKGKYGNGETRKNNLYNNIQKEVDRIL